ncbi:MAG: TonB-dependent receptor, partial [Deltaproteobacteria bacterium]|nr:TonB-dependent receptor [Deltaproteobacteria bacterium]
QSDFKAGEYNTVVVGFETEHEQGSSYLSSDSAFGPFDTSFGERSQHNNAGFLEDQLIYGEHVGATFGIRIDDNSKSGSEVTWKAAPSYLIVESGTRLKGSVGTGFKAPSLFQLYSEFGRQDLQPEESLGWDVGLEQQLPEGIIVDVTYFRNEFDNLINFDPGTFIFENIAEAETSGFEAVLRYKFMENGVLRAVYTYTDSEDNITGMSLLRRPKNKYALGARFSPAQGWNIDISCAYYGPRFDNDFSTFPAQRVKLGGYTLYNVAASYDITENLELFVRGENLSDKEYEEVFGFGEPGLAIYGGVRLHT